MKEFMLLSKKIEELEETVKFILKWVKINKQDLSVVPEFLKDGRGLESSFMGDKPIATGETGVTDGQSQNRGGPAPKCVKLKRKLKGIHEEKELSRGNETQSGNPCNSKNPIKEEVSTVGFPYDENYEDDISWDLADENSYDNSPSPSRSNDNENFLIKGDDDLEEKTDDKGPRVCDSNKRLNPYVKLPKLDARKRVKSKVSAVVKTEWKCCKCSALFPTRSAMETHKRQEKHYRPRSELWKNVSWKCNVCDAPFPTENVLRIHKRIEDHYRRGKKGITKTTEKADAPEKVEWKCNVCMVLFSSKKLLDSHKRKEKHFIRKNKKGYATCGYCGYRCFHGYRYENHLRTHTKERPFLCNTCGKSFSTNAALNSHMYGVHTRADGKRPFQCKYCGSCHKTASHLQLHERTHEGKTDKTCPHCGINTRSLTAHIREVHLKLRPFECHLCDHKFLRKTHLRRHVATHNNPNRRIKGYHIDRPENSKAPRKRTVLIMTEFNDLSNENGKKDNTTEMKSVSVLEQEPTDVVESADSDVHLQFRQEVQTVD